MLTSLALIFLVGLALAAISSRLHLPRIVGMLFTGIILGPYVLDLLDPSILMISADLRKIALIIILIKAGLSLDLADLKQVGRPAVLLSFVPASFELAAYTLIAPLLLPVTRSEAALMGAVLAAVSPAVVVPRMVHLIENRYGTDKSIPQMILAGASCDDIFVIVLFTSFLGMAQSGQTNLLSLIDIPVSIVLGILLGTITGCILGLFFEGAYMKNRHIRNSVKAIIVLGTAFLLMAAETWMSGTVALSGLLAVVSMACMLRIYSTAAVSKRLSQKFGKLWLAAEVILFVLVGAAVDIRYTLEAGFMAVLMIIIALMIRSVGVLLCLSGTKLANKEKLYCIFAYLPKATVQAAIGSVPLAAGLPCGKIILSVAVLGILITATAGAFLMDYSYPRCLTKEVPEHPGHDNGFDPV